MAIVPHHANALKAELRPSSELFFLWPQVKRDAVWPSTTLFVAIVLSWALPSGAIGCKTPENTYHSQHPWEPTIRQVLPEHPWAGGNVTLTYQISCASGILVGNGIVPSKSSQVIEVPDTHDAKDLLAELNLSCQGGKVSV